MRPKSIKTYILNYLHGKSGEFLAGFLATKLQKINCIFKKYNISINI